MTIAQSAAPPATTKAAFMALATALKLQRPSDIAYGHAVDQALRAIQSDLMYTFNALAAELVYTNLNDLPEAGGLTEEDFIGLNADLTPAQLLGFFTTMQALLEPLTVEQKKVIYAVKGSSQNILPPGI
jgi:hypothetical protein